MANPKFITGSKTCPNMITLPLITHVTGGRRRRGCRVVALDAKRQKSSSSASADYDRQTLQAEEESGGKVRGSPFRVFLFCSKTKQEERQEVSKSKSNQI